MFSHLSIYQYDRWQWGGQCRVPTNDIILHGGWEDGNEGLENLVEQRMVRDYEVEIDVYWGEDAKFELEVAELVGGNVVE
ncbi:Hypothetical predicted protein [Olea europaea subsp. europaea]|uniref:Uncharacterized protein n=1 Tax=Olea europaea subsp. europaea TaxID=158383 RepID=A0A8S0UB43_OLEEU|nr:Hypothetical predicted protein [Olea europaea subsp. europaea]